MNGVNDGGFSANILITTSTLPRWKKDSTPPFVLRFAESIATKGVNVFVLAPHAKGSAIKEQSGEIKIKRYRYVYPARFENIVYEGGGVGKIKKSPVYVFKLLCLLTSLFFNTLWQSVKNQADIINPHWVIPQGFIAVLVKFVTRKRVILTVHGSDIFSLTGKTMTKIKRFTLRHCDTVCVNSEATKKACEKVYRRDYKVIPMGVDTGIFRAVLRDISLARKYGLKDFIILFVGRLSEEKGVIYLCQALKKLSKNGYKYKAIVIGDGPLAGVLKKYLSDNDLGHSVVLPGWVSQHELCRYYSVADVFVGPSLSEAQGIVFIEALASGVPVIASNTGGIPEIVRDGINGYLVEPGSADRIYEKLSHLIDNPSIRKKFAKNAPHGISEKYSWDAVSREYGEAFKAVMSA